MIDETVGAALVVGGGIAGMQSALDLVEAGVKVHLVEKGPALGGVMVQLDKTFPTNDCAMCTLSPRMADAGRHPDIDLLTFSEVESVSGDVGRFTVKVRKKARFIDGDRCTGCGQCTDACTWREVPSEFDRGLGRRAVCYTPFPQAVPRWPIISRAGTSPCTFRCPAGIKAHGYVSLARAGEYEQAFERVLDATPLVGTLGRACYAPCEDECTRGLLEGSVPIRAIKRFVADVHYGRQQDRHDGAAATIPVADGKQVAVVGSGPAGLTAAWHLARQGYRVKVFEAEREPGGMPRLAIPDYRLPVDVVEKDIDNLTRLGVELATGTPVEDLKALRGDGFDAVIVATGTPRGAKVGVPGEDDLDGVRSALEFLREIKLGHAPDLSGRIVTVVGGGNVAVDAARSARRLGAAAVHLVCLESRAEMPAYDWEVEAARTEGVMLHDRMGIAAFRGAAGLEAVQLKACTSVFDAAGAFRPSYDDAVREELACDMAIVAIGMGADTTAFAELAPGGPATFPASPSTLQTSMPWIFVAGDAANGPTSIAGAVGHGRKAAFMVDRFLRGAALDETAFDLNLALVDTSEVLARRHPARRRLDPRTPAAELSAGPVDFSELERALSEDEMRYEAGRCLDCGICSECAQCEAACEVGAVDLKMRDREVELEVGAIVLASGSELVDPEIKEELGYGRYPNVVSSIQFERMLSASGPYTGNVVRRSDHLAPKRIAFIQCVGSREVDRNYCSSVCCMYATKEALIAKEHDPDANCTIFYIDLRAFGKGFESYVERARKAGVRYVRCRPSSVKEAASTNNLVIQYQEEQGGMTSEEFDMVVLSIGLRPTGEAAEMARTFGVATNEHGFVSTNELSPTETSRPGVYVAGTLSGPADIPESVMRASGAAAQVMSLLAGSRNTLMAAPAYPPERDVSLEEPRVGVFVCHCGRNIAGTVDVKDVTEYARGLPDVVYASDNLYTCSTDSLQGISKEIAELGLNRVVVASCTPRTHEPLFQDTLRLAGLNPYLFEMANIRDQCSWVHVNEPEAATQKAKDLVRMAVTRVRMLETLHTTSVPVNGDALVIGGGVAGMTAALNLADQGFRTHLLEKQQYLGGNARRLRFSADGASMQPWLQALIEKVENHPDVEVHLGATVVDFGGTVGNFQTAFDVGGERIDVRHGAVIVATGAEEYRPVVYDYGHDERVMTQLDLEEKLDRGELAPSSVVMIQCVGSRDESRGYCSRVCCTQAVKNAVKIKESSPGTPVYVLHRDVRTYGLHEAQYRKARQAGVRFIRFREDQPPRLVDGNGHMAVEVTDTTLGATLNVPCDTVVLAAAVVPNEDNPVLAQLLKVPRNQDGFFLEAHQKLRPMDFSSDGIYLCGLAHGPQSLDESVAQAQAAAARAATVLAKGRIEREPRISDVVDDNCDGCAYCIDTCPFHALSLVEYMKGGSVKKVAESDPSVCRGCGVCMATCPKGGINVRNFTLAQLSAVVESALAR